jgi:transposase
MRKSYRDADRDQFFLLPPSLRDWLPKGHLANFVVDVVAHLDLSSIEGEVRARDPRGTRAYSPRMMVLVLFYGYTTGVYSSRRIARACAENVAFRVVSGNNQPYFTNVAEFRKRFLPQLGALFVQVLHLCVEAGSIAASP